MEINRNNYELEQIDKRLLELEQKKVALLSQKKQLLEQAFPYRATDNSSSRATDNSSSQKFHNYKLSTDQKVELFGQLFHGRKDICATRWENKQGKNGYSVACSNGWQPVICAKPKVNCRDCRYRSFMPLDHAAIFEHLSGKKTIGLYPLLNNNECCLLAVDFDKSNWQADVTGFLRLV